MGTFIMLDGIDGSGKSTIISSWVEHLEQRQKVFRLKPYWLTHHKHPTLQELESYDVIVSSEPTSVWVGAAIRQELVQNHDDYSQNTVVRAFALDRLILYKRLLVPLLAQGKTIIQDRGVSTSLCYQPLEPHGMRRADIALVRGNDFALTHAPHHLVITDIPVSSAMNRLGGRTEKQDNAVFEKASFLEDARQTFLSKDFQQYFTRQDTAIHLLNTDSSIDIMKKDAITLLESILHS
ncbi:MAG: hypothetical protein HN726_00740 [Candidatus Magasanikbacteria bacterium]|jgi:dTMP kinase|nr:hypothetical protein [Candidatus Magasanikbacteria bacterium]MBT4350372.1 hypothetical protein [Candidatus Magasanikbacteria bacterium]MBT6252768.1 hypothetical protein [Candidatus Magasanikbacteria bacterium]MBT6334520.1 hypothetical protein [Candidatus Magasanikbacteria bacterium]MBT7754709.1 hypothetical protein [Candidatus Magasanikbacteria bacterium]